MKAKLSRSVSLAFFVTGLFLLALIINSGCMPLILVAKSLRHHEVHRHDDAGLGAVAGYVYMNNKLMPNFEVQIIDSNSVIIASGKTNQQGHYLIEDIPPGEYTVRLLSFAGVPQRETYEITLRPGRIECFDFDLGGVKIPKIIGDIGCN